MTEKITRDGIVACALELLAEGGLHALAMRRIAADLGVQPSALYWHFENKQQLLSAVADRIVEPIEATSGGDWIARTTSLASDLRAELLRYPDAAELVATAIAFRLSAQRPRTQFVDELVSGGQSPEAADVAASVLVHFVLGYTADEQQYRQAVALGAIESDVGFSPAHAEAAFLRGLELVIAGVDASR